MNYADVNPNVRRLIENIKNSLKINSLNINANAKKVGIQIPDGLKYWVHEIVDEVEKLGYDIIVSSSHTYGACDIDINLLKEVDLLLHIAHYPVVDIPKVVYVPYEVEYDPQIVGDFLDKVEERNISLISTAQYLHKINEVKKVLECENFEVKISKGVGRCKHPGHVLGCNYTAVDSTCEAIIFIGDGDFHPKGAAIYSGKKVYAISPLSGEFKIFDEKDVNKFLLSRYSKILKCENYNCKKFCVFVSSKPGQKRFGLAKKLKKLLKDKGKRCVIVYCDEVDFSNFVCDCFVNTACPRISYECKDSVRDTVVITPQELEILLGVRKWEDYELDVMY